jgi:hypothetical protein
MNNQKVGVARPQCEMILERQKDKLTAEWKYRIHGKSLAGRKVEAVTKLSPTGKLVIITVYRL